MICYRLVAPMRAAARPTGRTVVASPPRRDENARADSPAIRNAKTTSNSLDPLSLSRRHSSSRRWDPLVGALEAISGLLETRNHV